MGTTTKRGPLGLVRLAISLCSSPRFVVIGSILFPLLFGLPRCEAIAQAIPEPSIILYGTIKNGANARVTTGKLTWRFVPANGGAPIVLETTLTNINDQFSYILRVPCETELPGLTVSPNTLKLTSTPASYDRAQVTVDGKTATLLQPQLGAFSVSSLDRGRIERVDLQTSLPAETFGEWAQRIFGRSDINPQDDPDKDGMSNLAEFKAGTHPRDPSSAFEFINVKVDATGGFLIEWSSIATKSYAIQRSSDLLTGYVDIASRIAATPPINSFRDATAPGAGPFFYRLRLEE